MLTQADKAQRENDHCETLPQPVDNDPLQCCKNNANSLPFMAALAIKYLRVCVCVCGTSVPSERLFSRSG